MQFELKSKFMPTGDQPKAIDTIVKNIQKGVKNQILLGVTGSGKTFTVANIINRLNRPSLIIAPNKTLAAQLYNEYKNFFPDNAVEYFVSYYDYYQPEAYIPATDTYIEKDSSINDEIDKLRHAATAALLTRRDVIIIASVSAIYGLGSKKAYSENALVVDKKFPITRKQLLEKLVELRFERNDIEFARGKFRIKGDIIDVRPTYMENAYRFKFWDEELEDIVEIDSLSSKKIRSIKRMSILPATHYLSTQSKLKMFNDIKDEMVEAVRNFEKNEKQIEAIRIKQRTEYDIEMIREIGYCKGIENYSRYLSGKEKGEAPDTLLDYFPSDMLVFIDESHITVSQIGAMYNGDRSRKKSLIENGFRLESAYDNRPLKKEEFFEKARQIVYISATPSEYEIEVSKDNVVEQLIRPTGIVEPEILLRDTQNQIEDLLEEIIARTKKSERVLVTTLTKKMAEELTEYYLNFGIKIRYMHSDIDTIERVDIIRELRKGEIDVIVGINLLREGLDIPEVSLVAVLEADKEGFLRSRRSLIQVMGRAARNINGKVILYANKETKAIKEAVDEVNRRRFYQKEYNKKNNIVPKNTSNNDTESLLEYDNDNKENEVEKYLSSKQIENRIEKLEKKLTIAVSDLDFEEAIKLRDEIKKLKRLLMEVM